ncbi:hypothetical protein CISIN_1g0218222mg, partial [Citrus sinensis]
INTANALIKCLKHFCEGRRS